MASIWLAQIAPKLLNVEFNLSKCLKICYRAAAENVSLVVFPECTLSGYMLNSKQEVKNIAETIPGFSTNAIINLCKKLFIYVIIGLIEVEKDDFYNTAVLIGPNGILLRYRKAHIPEVGVDKFLTKGNIPFKCIDTTLGRIGLLICYDIKFPEATRVLALNGAQIIIFISNWPKGAEVNPNLLMFSRAIENGIYMVGVNRAGAERGILFIGKSVAISPHGKLIVMASEKEEIIKLDLDLENHKPGLITVPESSYSLNLFEDRRPELYKELIKKWN